jgi:hypothetical protein
MSKWTMPTQDNYSQRPVEQLELNRLFRCKRQAFRRFLSLFELPMRQKKQYLNPGDCKDIDQRRFQYRNRYLCREMLLIGSIIRLSASMLTGTSGSLLCNEMQCGRLKSCTPRKLLPDPLSRGHSDAVVHMRRRL